MLNKPALRARWTKRSCGSVKARRGSPVSHAAKKETKPSVATRYAVCDKSTETADYEGGAFEEGRRRKDSPYLRRRTKMPPAIPTPTASTINPISLSVGAETMRGARDPASAAEPDSAIANPEAIFM